MEVDEEMENISDTLRELEDSFSRECSQRQTAIKAYEESMQRAQEDFNAKMDSSTRSSKQILSKLRRLRSRQDSLCKLLATQSQHPQPPQESSTGNCKSRCY